MKLPSLRGTIEKQMGLEMEHPFKAELLDTKLANAQAVADATKRRQCCKASTPRSLEPSLHGRCRPLTSV